MFLYIFQLQSGQLDIMIIASYTFVEYVSHAPRNNLRDEKGMDNNQLCWHCWQQLNPAVDVDQTEGFHLMQSNSIPKPAGYQSSDSDIWSEPDRNVSMQRIGISLQNSPVSSKSPRKFKQKDKRISSKISSKEDTSSSDLQAFRKRQGRFFYKKLLKFLHGLKYRFEETCLLYFLYSLFLFLKIFPFSFHNHLKECH